MGRAKVVGVEERGGYECLVQYEPTSGATSDLMLEILDLKPGQVLMELGSGDGRNLVKAALKYGCRGIGYEIQRWLVEEAQKRIKEAGVEHLVTIVHDTLMNADISQADALFLFLSHRANTVLEPKILAEGKRGLKIASNYWRFPSMEPLRVEKTPDSTVYYYQL